MKDNPATQQPSNPATQQPSNPATQQPSNPATQQPSNPATQQPSNPATQQPMKYTYQTFSESHSFSTPEGTDVEHASNLGDLRAALEDWRDEHGNVGTAEEYAQIVVWRGTLKDVTDEYPDFILKSGPRGGMIKESC